MHVFTYLKSSHLHHLKVHVEYCQMFNLPFQSHHYWLLYGDLWTTVKWFKICSMYVCMIIVTQDYCITGNQCDTQLLWVSYCWPVMIFSSRTFHLIHIFMMMTSMAAVSLSLMDFIWRTCELFLSHYKYRRYLQVNIST